MEGQLSKFEATLQGSLSRSDQAYAADAVALQFTAKAAAAKPNTCGLSLSPATGTATVTSSSSSSGGSESSTRSPPALPDAFGAVENITRNPARLANPIGFGTAGQNGLSLEPTVFLDQMKRYLDHLNELRRINEGDDTVDAPGYSLNLVRIPVSVLPGHQTVQGFGAEITLTLKSHMHPELLPTTFKNLVINDLIEQLGVPLTQFTNSAEGSAYLDEVANGNLGELTKPGITGRSFSRFSNGQDTLMEPSKVSLEKATWIVKNRLTNIPTRPLMQILFGYYATPGYLQLYEDYYESIRGAIEYPIEASLALVSSPRRRAQRPVPTSQITDVYGREEYLALACDIYRWCGFDIPNKDVTHYTDVQSWLHDELQAAYELLEDPANVHLWHYCDHSLASAIRARRVEDVKGLRKCFEQDIMLRSPGRECDTDQKYDDTVILAWAIIVDSALLNDQLVEDMKKAASARGGCCLPTEPLPYYLPCPPPEARQAFNDYVLCRWPNHVFAASTRPPTSKTSPTPTAADGKCSWQFRSRS